MSELKQLINFQNKFLKLLKNDKIPTIEVICATKCVMFYYDSLSATYRNSASKTRKRDIPVPKHEKSLNKKNCIYTAIKYFNSLPNNYRNMKMSHKIFKQKVMNEIENNMTDCIPLV